MRKIMKYYVWFIMCVFLILSLEYWVIGLLRDVVDSRAKGIGTRDRIYSLKTGTLKKVEWFGVDSTGEVRRYIAIGNAGRMERRIIFSRVRPFRLNGIIMKPFGRKESRVLEPGEFTVFQCNKEDTVGIFLGRSRWKNLVYVSGFGSMGVYAGGVGGDKFEKFNRRSYVVIKRPVVYSGDTVRVKVFYTSRWDTTGKMDISMVFHPEFKVLRIVSPGYVKRNSEKPILQKPDYRINPGMVAIYVPLLLIYIHAELIYAIFTWNVDVVLKFLSRDFWSNEINPYSYRCPCAYCKHILFFWNADTIITDSLELEVEVPVVERITTMGFYIDVNLITYIDVLRPKLMVVPERRSIRREASPLERMIIVITPLDILEVLDVIGVLLILLYFTRRWRSKRRYGTQENQTEE